MACICSARRRKACNDAIRCSRSAVFRPAMRQGANASVLTALARDLQLGETFDPLDADWAAPWTGPRPAELEDVIDAPWRHHGDTRERLELLATSLLDRGARSARMAEHFARTDAAEGRLARRLDACGPQELEQLQRGLEGRFVPPGPSGSPSRGRPDVLPTGRNFYSVDTRARADASGVVARAEVSQPADRAASAGSRRLSARGRFIGVGHGHHAHRRRRYRAGAGADRRAAEVGGGQPSRDGLRDPADHHLQPSAHRRDVARVGIFPRCVREPHASLRCRRASRRRTRRRSRRR